MIDRRNSSRFFPLRFRNLYPTDLKITIQGRRKQRASHRYVTIRIGKRDCDNIQILDSGDVVAISFLQSIRLIVIQRIVSQNVTLL